MNSTRFLIQPVSSAEPAIPPVRAMASTLPSTTVASSPIPLRYLVGHGFVGEPSAGVAPLAIMASASRALEVPR